MKTHMLVHSGDKPHACPECGKRFSIPGNMKTHMLVHSGDKPHECSEYGKRFSRLGDMKTHMLVHSEDKHHKCPECGKRFSRHGHMKTHRMVHSGPSEVELLEVIDQVHGELHAQPPMEWARETEITVSNEIDKLDVQKSLIPEWRSDLQMISKELELNTGTTSRNIKYSIEAVAHSIRHRKNLIATHHKNDCDRKKLQGFIKTYNSENSETLSEKDAIEGILPWHNLLPHTLP
ncbi:uncharacterized protein [Procambarus clarkii]|uniref:uncharacterized protein n=1 Tax=Procambarus clarkii TaxID=6728 RepID=UPI0037424297